MYETLILPWFQYARAPTLATEGLPELETWVENMRLEHDLPRFRVRIQNGPFNNAFAIGGLGASLIVVGKGLVDRLSEPHLKAIVAHELAHVARRDVPRLIPPVAIATTLFSISLVTVSNPLFATFEVWGFASGALLAGLSYWVLILSIPGFFMRRMEFGAESACRRPARRERNSGASTRTAVRDYRPAADQTDVEPSRDAGADRGSALSPGVEAQQAALGFARHRINHTEASRHSPPSGSLRRERPCVNRPVTLTRWSNTKHSPSNAPSVSISAR